MSDAQLDSNDNATAAQDNVAGFIGDKDNAGAVRWYAMFSLACGVGAIPFYVWFNSLTYVSRNAGWYGSNIEVFVPVFAAWVMVSFFDGEMMREIFEVIVTFSILGPFANHWYQLAGFYLAGEGSYLDSLEFWIWFAAYSAFTIFQQIVQLILLPQIYDWADEAAIKDNDSKSLLAVLF